MKDIHEQTALDLFEADVARVKENAGFFMAKRRKDAELYGVISQAMALCERAQSLGLVNDLRARVIERDRIAGKRAYFERGADVFLIVGRYVFEPEINRAASWRYTATMREAAKIGLNSGNVQEWLATNGGVNALFRPRAKELRKRTSVKTLHLNEPVEFDEGKPFTITLRRSANGFFDVMKGDEECRPFQPAPQKMKDAMNAPGMKELYNLGKRAMTRPGNVEHDT